MEINLQKLTAQEDDVIVFYTEAGLLGMGTVIDVYDEGVVIGVPTEEGLFPWCVEFQDIVEKNPINSRPFLN